MSENKRLKGGENYSLATIFQGRMTRSLFLTSSEIIVGEMKTSTSLAHL